MLSELFLIIGIVTLGLYWLAAMRCKELAVMAARRECKRCDVQLLDQTVHQVRFSLSRDAEMHWKVWRQYKFEYSEDGVSRHSGSLILLGQRLKHVALETFNPIIH